MPDRDERSRDGAMRPVLVLAGTREARALLERATGLAVLASLAGRTEGAALPVPTRRGGFGGDDGFRAALTDASAVLDATHPFATTMSERAARICAETRTPYLRLGRAPWPSEPGWIRHASPHDAAASLPAGARAFLAVGPGGAGAFLGRGLALWCRRIDPAPPMPGLTWIVGGPGGLAAEARLLRDLDVGHVVAKDSGGAGRAKLDAAAAMGIAVHLIDRPPPPPGEETYDAERALAFLRRHAQGRGLR